MTAEEFLGLPDDGKRYDLVKGELVEAPHAGREHGYVAARVPRKLGSFLEWTGSSGEIFAADTGFKLAHDPGTVRASDVAYPSAENAPWSACAATPLSLRISPSKWFSPSDRAGELSEKVREWLSAGTRLVLVLYPSTRAVQVFGPDRQTYILLAGDTLRCDAVLPGFACPVEDLFGEMTA